MLFPQCSVQYCGFSLQLGPMAIDIVEWLLCTVLEYLFSKYKSRALKGMLKCYRKANSLHSGRTKFHIFGEEIAIVALVANEVTLFTKCIIDTI